MPWAQQHLKLSICIWQCLLWHPWQQPVCVVKLNSSQSPKLSIWHPSNPQYVCGVRLKGFRIWSARCHSCWEIDFAASERSEQLSNWATEQLSKSVWRILYIFQYLGFIFLTWTKYKVHFSSYYRLGIFGSWSVTTYNWQSNELGLRAVWSQTSLGATWVWFIAVLVRPS